MNEFYQLRLPSRELVCSLLAYDAEIGQLRWRIQASSRRPAGSIAGCSVTTHGHRQIMINQVSYMAHRLIWLCVKGEDPIGFEIDHINGIVDDNRIKNLRISERTTNGRNRAIAVNNTSGATGVRKEGRKWRVRIKVDGKLLHVGCFRSYEEAVMARQKAELEHFQDFAPHVCRSTI